MSENKRTSNQSYSESLSSPGPYIGRVVNNIDPMRQGALEVELLRRVGNQPSASQQLFTVRYLSPFYGVTGVEHNGTDDYDFNHTQKSYGFWAVPPDTGTLVMVIFVDSDPGQGYWIGCVQDAYMNHMIPGIAASESFNQTVRKNDEERWGVAGSTTEEYGAEVPIYAGNGTRQLPVGEINRVALRNQTPQAVVDANIKPVHPIAENLSTQGLLEDTVRGTHTSSARRDAPSNVYGMSTPGPIDKRIDAQKGKIGRKDASVQSFVSRLGGHSIVMDDGNDRKLRKGKPWEEPYEYVDIEQGATDGLSNFPKDESFRIRTRTGHQILMHNAEDLIYITNARGTAWIELTSNGKIDIYALDSISIRTEQDFNFVATRDFNVHAGRAINLFSTSSSGFSSGADLSLTAGTIMRVASDGETNITGNGNLTFTGQYEDFDITTKNFNITTETVNIKSGSDVQITAQNNMELLALSGSVAIASEKQFHVTSAESMYLTSRKNFHLRSEIGLAISAVTGNLSMTSKGVLAIESTDSMSLKGGPRLALNADEVLINSGGAIDTVIAKVATVPRAATGANNPPAAGERTDGLGGSVGGELTLYPLPGVGQVIVKRAPTAEPWRHHENFNPAGFTPDLTDRENPAMPYAFGDDPSEIRNSDDADSIPSDLGGNGGDFRGHTDNDTSLRPNLGQNASSGGKNDLADYTQMPRDWVADKEFLSKVQEVAGSIGTQFVDLLTVMMFETAGTMSPGVVNPRTGRAVGLIQFTPIAVKDLKKRGGLSTSLGALAEMTRVEQMEYVQKYFELVSTGVPRPLDLGTLYLLVFAPAYAKTGGPNTVIASRSSTGERKAWWNLNKALRTSPTGPITKASVARAPLSRKGFVISELERGGYSVSGGSTGPGITPGAPSGGHGGPI
jgi:uncharacterized protein (DUF2345 family)